MSDREFQGTAYHEAAAEKMGDASVLLSELLSGPVRARDPNENPRD